MVHLPNLQMCSCGFVCVALDRSPTKNNIWTYQERSDECLLWVSKVINQLCIWQNAITNTNSKVPGRGNLTEHKRNSKVQLFRRKLKGLGTWLKEILRDSNISNGVKAFATCPQGYKLNLSSDGRYYELSTEDITKLVQKEGQQAVCYLMKRQ